LCVLYKLLHFRFGTFREKNCERLSSVRALWGFLIASADIYSSHIPIPGLMTSKCKSDKKWPSNSDEQKSKRNWRCLLQPVSLIYYIVIIFESLLLTFVGCSFFWGCWGSSENCLEPKNQTTKSKFSSLYRETNCLIKFG
jgi:hypothetical protein